MFMRVFGGAGITDGVVFSKSARQHFRLHCQRPLKAVICVDKYNIPLPEIRESQLDCDTIQKNLLFSHSLPKGVIG